MCRACRRRARRSMHPRQKPVANRGRQRRARRSSASPLHAGLAMAANRPGRLMSARSEAPRGARGGSGAPPVQTLRGRRGRNVEVSREATELRPRAGSRGRDVRGWSVLGCAPCAGTRRTRTHPGRCGPAAFDGQAVVRELLDSALGWSERGSRVSRGIGGTPELSDWAAELAAAEVQADG